MHLLFELILVMGYMYFSSAENAYLPNMLHILLKRSPAKRAD